MKKTLCGTIALIMIAALPAPSFANDGYAPEMLGESYRDYSVKKIQQGYYPEVFTRIDLRQKNRIFARNQAEQVVAGSYQAGPYSNYAILSLGYLQQYNADTLKQEIGKIGHQRISAMSALTEFTYVLNSDGKKSYFKDGLTTRVVNERIANELGQVSMKNTYNMKYNDDRLMIGYEADITDGQGNTSHMVSKDMVYMAGAKFYANENTKAHKNMDSYSIFETDHAGNPREINWQADSYDGKLLRAYTETINDSVYGLTWYKRSDMQYSDPKHLISYHEEGEAYHDPADGIGLPTYALDRTGITYNGKDQVTGYHEVRKSCLREDGQTEAVPESEWITTVTDAQFTYTDRPHQFGDDVEPDPGLLTASTMTTVTTMPDGTTRTELSTTDYTYKADWSLEDVSSHNVFNGSKTWYYDREGHGLTREYKDGAVRYYYTDADGNQVDVPESDVTSGTTAYDGTAEIDYEIIAGQPVATNVRQTTNYYKPGEEGTDRVLFMTEEQTTANTYDAKGNLTATTAAGSGSGYKFDENQQLWLETNDYDIIVTYSDVTWGRTKIEKWETKDKQEG